MNIATNFDDNYSNEYLKRFESAMEESKSFNFPNPPKVNHLIEFSESDLDSISHLINAELFPRLSMCTPEYWGNSCQMLSSHLFGFLNARGIKADIVIGEVQVHGMLEYETELEALRRDYGAEKHEGGQMLHAWVSIGGDVIIDGSLSDRMIKHYGLPKEYARGIFVERATLLSKGFYARHQPMIVGADFLARTNEPNPYHVLDFHLKQLGKTKTA